MPTDVFKSLLAFAVLATLVSVAFGQSQAPKKEQAQQPGTSDALEFLGSYSAPNAIVSTETGHTSAHPPAPPTDRRLHRIEGGAAILPPWPTDFAWPAQSLVAACSRGGAPAGQATAQGSLPDADRATMSSEFVRAESALRGSRFGEAASVYARVSIQHPTCGPLRWNRALAESYSLFPKAPAQLASAQPDAPSAAAGRLFLGICRLVTEDADGARKDLLPLLTQYEAGAAAEDSSLGEVKIAERDVLWARAVLAWASGEPGEARHWLSRLAASDADTPSVWFVLGSVALEEARQNSRRLDELAPESSWNRRLEGEALAARYPSLARRVMLKGAENASVEIKSGGPPTDQPSERAKMSESSRPVPLTTDSAERVLQELEFLPDSKEVFYQRARAALQLSEIAYAHAARSPLFGAQLHALRALAAEQEDDESAAIREYRAGLGESPQSAALHAGLGHLYRARSDLEPARHELEEAYALDPADPVVAFELGDVYLRLGQPNRSLELLNRGLEMDAGLLVAQWSRGKAYLALGDDQKALADLEAAAPADSSGELQWQLARLYEKLGRPDLAVKARKLSDDQRRAIADAKQKAMDAAH